MGDGDRDNQDEPARDIPDAGPDLSPPSPPTAPQPPIQLTPPPEWPALREPLGEPPLPDLAPLGSPPEPPAKVTTYRRAEPRRPRKPLWRRILMWALKLVIGFVLLSALMVAIFRFVPPPITWTMIGDIFAGHGVTKKWMPLSRIDPSMARAAIAAEDSRFCQHGGFDYKAIAAAAMRNATGTKRIRGGSTISQQTAKNVFLWQGGGYFRKGLEAYFTVLIENIWGKRRIMEVYLNVAETGIGTYGVNAGAMRYFKHDASRLSPREAALIAAVLPLPKKRAAIDPKGFTRRYGNSITARIGVVRGDGLDACLR